MASSTAPLFSLASRGDVLVNNAGIGIFTPFDEPAEDEFEAVLGTNSKGSRRRIQVFRPALEASGGSAINSSGVHGASKASVIQMTRYFAVHLAPARIRVNSITPGGVFAGQDPALVAAPSSSRRRSVRPRSRSSKW